MSHQIKTCEEILTETAEKIVIDYANYSGRESDNRAAFRESIQPHILLAMRTAVEQCRPKEMFIPPDRSDNPRFTYKDVTAPHNSGYNRALYDMDSLKSSFFGEKK